MNRVQLLRWIASAGFNLVAIWATFFPLTPWEKILAHFQLRHRTREVIPRRRVSTWKNRFRMYLDTKTVSFRFVWFLTVSKWHCEKEMAKTTFRSISARATVRAHKGRSGTPIRALLLPLSTAIEKSIRFDLRKLASPSG